MCVGLGRKWEEEGTRGIRWGGGRRCVFVCVGFVQAQGIREGRGQDEGGGGGRCGAGASRLNEEMEKVFFLLLNSRFDTNLPHKATRSSMLKHPPINREIDK